jgi:hypothetical protein
MLQVPVKQFLYAGGVHCSPHLTNGAIDHALSGAAVIVARGLSGKLAHDFFSAIASGFH